MPQTIYDWYRLSRSGTRGAFLKALSALSPTLLAQMARGESALPPTSRTRKREELDALARTSLPSLAMLRASEPNEQTLQWLFLHRGYLAIPKQTVLLRELPNCHFDQPVAGRADLFAFDRQLQQPILIELKRAKALDPLTAAVLEILFHWVFHTRYRDDLEELIGSYGFACSTPPQLVIAAPHLYFNEAKRRSSRRHGEYERALIWIEELCQRQIVEIDLLAIDNDWLQIGPGFPISQLLGASRSEECDGN
jgi:hypothetical protein